jgi:signal transduction histidine kinase
MVYVFVGGLLFLLVFTTAWGTATRIYVEQTQEELQATILPASHDASELTAAYGDQQRGLRGYFLTGNRDLLEPWREGRRRAAQLERRLDRLLSDDDTSAGLLEDVVRSGQTWRVDHVAPALAEQRAAGTVDVLSSTEMAAGSLAFEEVRADLSELSTRLDAVTADRFDAIAAAQRAANIAIWSGVALAVATGVVAVVLVRRWLVQPLDRLLAQVGEAALPPHPGPVTGEGPAELWSLARGVESLRVGMHESAGDLAAARREITLRQERERLAADLHDLVVQRVFAMGLSLSMLVQRHPELRERVAPLVHEADQVTAELREVIFDLRRGPVTLGALRERAAELTDDASRILGFAPDLRVVGSVDASISGEVAYEALAVLREALSNVAKHAGASAVEVSIGVEDGDVELCVADDGTRQAAPSANGHGLRNMRARAVRLGGRMDIVQPGRGTTMTWRVPRDGPDDGGAAGREDRSG